MHRFFHSLSLIVLMFLFSLLDVKAQQEVLSSGGDAQGGSGSFSWSVGQVSDRNFTGSNGFISEGVQQPAEFFLTGADVFEISGVQLFPNPGTDVIRLKGLEQLTMPAPYRILNSIGQELQHGILSLSKPMISVVELPTGVYTLHLVNSIESHSFSFVKH
jgi:hypothetical protein